MLDRKRIINFPGMGATGEMHKFLKVNKANLINLNWPDDKTYGSFNSLAERLIAEYKITNLDVLCGSSMGGMIAAEIGLIVESNLVVQIGSCTNRESVLLHRFLGLGCKITSDLLIKTVGLKGRISMLAKMINQVNPAFIRNSLDNMSKWDGVKLPNGVLKSVHGMMDPIIPYYKEFHDRKIIMGGHFIALSNPKAVSQFIDSLV